MITFRARLTRVLALSTATFLSLFCLGLYLWCRSAFLADLDGDLEAIFRADFATGNNSGHTHVSKQPARFGEFEIFKLLMDMEGRVVESTSQQEIGIDFSSESLHRIANEGPIFANLNCPDGLYRTLATPVKMKERTMIEVIGISQAPMLESLEELERALGVSLLLALGLVALISRRLAGHLTAPIEGVIAQIESVANQGDASLRVTGRFHDRETASLQSEVNAMLDRLEQALSLQKQFVSNASHELRAPLANLTLAIEVCLRRTRTPEEYVESLQTCLAEAKRLNQMAEQMLTLSRFDEGVTVIKREPTPLSGLLGGCVQRNQNRGAARGVRVALSCPELTVEVDPIKLSQVVDNLLDNAIRHSPDGGSVEVAATIDQELLVIKIRDQGPGLSQEQMSRLFERFYRADPSRQRGSGGAGLGLSIAQALVEAHGGRLMLESPDGGGTTAIIRLPLEPSPAPAGSRSLAPS